MNKNIMLPIVALMILAMAGFASAAEEVDKVEIRGTVQEIITTPPTAYTGFEWNSTNFAGFWYDIEKDVASETLEIQALAAGENTIPKHDATNDGLNYTTVRQGAEYKNPELRIAGGDYYVLGWFANKHVAVNGNPDRISKIILEMGSTDKKTLATGENWDIGNGYSLIANQIDLDGNKVWLSLEKDGAEVESSIINTGANPAGDTFVDVNGNDVTTNDTFVYQPDIGSESDVPIFTIAVTAVFRGTDSNVLQLKYAMLIDDNIQKIESDYESHKMKVTSIKDASITMQNDEDVTLTRDSDVKIMGDIIFRVAKDSDSDTTPNNEYRFYPMVEYTIGAGAADAEPTATATTTATTAADVNVTDGEGEGVGDGEGEGEGEAVATATTAPTEKEVEEKPEDEEAATKKKVPGFEAIFAISGLLAVAYLVLRQRD